MGINQKRKAYIVSQGGHYKEEYACGYLFAPYHADHGMAIHHWERMTELKPGDKVFHYSKGYIRSYNAKGKQTSTAIIRYEHGRMVSAILYDGAGKKKKISEVKLSYKKVRTSKYSAVRKQQDDLKRIGQ